MGLFTGLGMVAFIGFRLSASSPVSDARIQASFIMLLSGLVLDVLAGGAAAGMGGAILDGRLSAPSELAYGLVAYGAGSAALALLILGLISPYNAKFDREDDLREAKERAYWQNRIALAVESTRKTEAAKRAAPASSTSSS